MCLKIWINIYPLQLSAVSTFGDHIYGCFTHNGGSYLSCQNTVSSHQHPCDTHCRNGSWVRFYPCACALKMGFYGFTHLVLHFRRQVTIHPPPTTINIQRPPTPRDTARITLPSLPAVGAQKAQVPHTVTQVSDNLYMLYC